MAYSDNFPATRPVFQADFANGGRIDPRATFSRASTANVFDGAKHKSSENILLQSSDFDTTWANSRLASPTANQTDPSGGTDGYTLAEDSSSGAHRLTQSVTATGDLAFTVFAKQNSGTRYLTLAFFNANNDTVLAVYDLAGGSPVTATGSSSTYTSVSTSQTASGNGYYKCVLKATGTVTLAGVNLNDASTTAGLDTTLARKVYTGDGSSSIDVAFASLSTTGATDYNATTTQIHREYASSLVSKANNAARFEVGTDGQSMGLLVESQFTQHLLRTEEFDNASWSKTNATVQSNSAIAPSGELTADLLVESDDTVAASHFAKQSFTPASGVSYTYSFFAKPAGRSSVRVQGVFGGANGYADINLSTKSVSGATGSINNVTATDVGNGWVRVEAVIGPTTGTGGGDLYVWLNDGSGISYIGDGYSGVILWGANLTQSSHSFSYLKAEGAASTKAADSLSVATADIGYTGGDGSLFIDLSINARSSGMGAFLSSDADNYYMVGQFASTLDYALYSELNNSAQINQNESSTAIGSKRLAASWSTNDASSCINGGTVATDTSNAFPLITDLHIGSNQAGAAVLNGHVKRVALYNEALTDTNLQALTS